MAQKAIEVILTRQLSTYLSMPIFIVDTAGTLVFYNEPAERVLGMRFEETGEMPADEWATAFTPTDEKGTPLATTKLPLMVAVSERRPAHARFWIRGLDGVRRHLEVGAFPLIGHLDRSLGAVAIFWDLGTA